MVAPQATVPSKSSAKTAARKANSVALVGINSASMDDLTALPGIGNAYSDKTVKGSACRGKNELLDKKLFSTSVYTRIKGQIVARQK